EVEDADREERYYEQLPAVPKSKWPSVGRAASLGVGAGLVAGMLIGLTEGAVVIADGGGRASWGVMAYGAVAYGLLGALVAAPMLIVSAVLGRAMQREAIPEPPALARTVAFLVASL